MDEPPIVPVDDMEPCVPLGVAENPGADIRTEFAPPGTHPSGMNREQRRAAYARHKAADRARRLANQRRTR